jgi:hypothetical protein
MLLQTTVDKRGRLYRVPLFVVSSTLPRIICFNEIIPETRMQKIFRIVLTYFFVLATVTLSGCTSPPAEENKNAEAPVRSAQQSNSSEPKVLREGTPSAQQAEGPGEIEVNSDPPGAQVLLIEENEAGTSAPKPRGVTPTKITGLPAGKYTIHMEKPGYTASQKNVKVVPNQTVKVNARLKKE